VIITVLILLTASGASAQICGGFVSQLNAPNDAGLYGGAAPTGGSFGTVCVTLNASNTVATITYNVNSGYLIGAEDAMFAQINKPLGTFTATASATTFTGHSAPSLTVENPPGTQQADGLGAFNLDAKNTDGFGDAFRTGQLQVTLTTGTFASVASVLAFNSTGIDAGVHIFKCSDAATCTAGASLTGYVGETTTATVVPEPTSVALFGGVLLVVGMKLRKRFV